MIGFRTHATPSTPVDDLYGGVTWKPSSANAVEPTLPQQDEAFRHPLLAREARPFCASPACGKELRFWKKSARPILHGQWLCSRECARALVQKMVRERLSTLSNLEEGTHRHRIPLGLVLLNQGVINAEQLRLALEAQRRASAGRIGAWLQELCGVPEQSVTRALAAQWNRPVLSSRGFQAARMALVLPEALREAFSIMPVRIAAGKILYTAFEDRIDLHAVSVLEQMTGLVVEPGLMAGSEWAACAVELQDADGVPCEIKSARDHSALVNGIVDSLFDVEPIASRLVATRSHWWLRMWLEPAAVDARLCLPASAEDVVDVLFQR